MSTLTLETRNDLHLTSTGVAHSIRDQPTDQGIKAIRNNPLPPTLAQPSPSNPLTVDDVYQTTTASTHNFKMVENETLLHPLYKKAPGSWKVKHTLDTVAKLAAKSCRRPLTMGNQCSEMKGQFRAEPEAISTVVATSANAQPPVLCDHFKDGPTKTLVPSTTNLPTKGRAFVPQNQAVLDRLEPYMTSNRWFHRSFSKTELGRYPRKDVATYWQCEEYPKAWGHGMIDNPLPRRLNRTDPGPMRDRTIFRTGTTIPRLPKSLQPVTNGLRSCYADTFNACSDEKRRELFHCPVESTIKIKAPDNSLLQAVPHMYKTSNMSYGNGPVAVS